MRSSYFPVYVSVYNKKLKIMKMKKTCTECEVTYDDIPKMFYMLNVAKGDVDCYCKPCRLIYNKRRLGLLKCKEWAEAGFNNEQEHFDAALKHYAQLFNAPQILKHLTPKKK